MEHCILVAGFGGQGVLLIGSILCHAGMDEGLNVSWLPSYGPEMRGGTASCSVTLSSDEIGSPVVTKPDICIVMNQPSYDRYLPAVKPGGKLFVNASLIDRSKTRGDIEMFLVPATDIAKELGNLKIANMAMLGAVLVQTGVVQMQNAINSLARILAQRRKHLLPVNERAMVLGDLRTKK